MMDIFFCSLQFFNKLTQSVSVGPFMTLVFRFKSDKDLNELWIVLLEPDIYVK